MESNNLDNTLCILVHLNLYILHMFKGTFSFDAAHILVSEKLFQIYHNLFITLLLGSIA